MAQKPNRPISPHLGIYRRGPHMMVSIIHRATGFILATAGMLMLTWWLVSISGGQESYALFQAYVVDAGANGGTVAVASNWFFRATFFAVIYSFFQHFYSGIRHLVMDMGAGYELNANRRWTLTVFAVAFLSAAAAFLVILARVKGV